jgi:hypothetical protein
MSKPTEAHFRYMVESGQMTQAEAEELREEAEIGAYWLIDTVEDAWVSYAISRGDVGRFTEFLRKHVVKEGDQQEDNVQHIVDAFAFREAIRPTEPPPQGGRCCGSWTCRRHERQTRTADLVWSALDSSRRAEAAQARTTAAGGSVPMKTRRIRPAAYLGATTDSPARLLEVLTSAASARFDGDVDAVALWLRSRNPALAMKRPRDLCGDPHDLARAVFALT